MKKGYILIISILLAFLLAFSGCATQSLSNASAPAPPSTVAPSLDSPPSSISTLADIEATLKNIYTRVSPSVVNIRVIQKQEVMFPTLPEIPGFPFFNLPVPQGPQEYYSKGLGSGFVWDKEGHIVTNNHVVSGADRISVTFQDGTTVSGKVIGSDPDSDLAVVKVETSAEDLQPVQIADSNQVKVGQLAVAIGNPFGLQGTMTVGFVSALGRLLPADGESAGGSTYSIPDVIQTDAPINPGNSGGVLVDRDGEVIGVTSAIISSTGTNAGIGFAIPSAIVQKVVPALIKTGHYEHPWLGISGLSLNPDIAKAMGLKPEQRGALIVDVVPNSPADKAELHGSDRRVAIDGDQIRVGGDVITAIDGQPVKTFDDLVTYLARSTEIGQSVTLNLMSQGREKQVKVTLVARPESQQKEKQTTMSSTGQAWLGIWGMTVTPEIAKAMNLPSDQKGVLVEQVQQGSPADKAGLRGSYKPVTIGGQQVLVGGDIIIALNSESVSRIEELQSLIQKHAPGDEVMLKLLRDRVTLEKKVTLGERSVYVN
jgi:S1-C subfamily serine protease